MIIALCGAESASNKNTPVLAGVSLRSVCLDILLTLAFLVKKMSCLYPVEIFLLSKFCRDSGLPTVLHDLRKASPKYRDKYFNSIRPCGSCIECRLQKSSYIATRCVHQSKMHTQNSFLTLTYSDEALPVDLSLSTDVIQKFWKKMRKHIYKETGQLIKHYSAGEYGDGTGQRAINPHYHACLFGYDFPDKKYYKKTENGDVLYTSQTLEKIWGYGFCPIGDVSFESAGYVARYTLKKVYGDDADKHYSGRLPEQSWSSNGLGESWFLQWYSDVYPSDQIVIDGRVMMPPPYYDELCKKYLPDLWTTVSNNRAGKINNKKNNLVLERFTENGMMKTRSVSDVVRRAQIRSGSLDKNR